MEQVWLKVKQAVKDSIPEAAYRLWIEPLEYMEGSNKALVVACPNFYSKKRINNQYLPVIKSEIKRLAGRNLNVELIIKPNGKGNGDGNGRRPSQMVLPCVAVQPHYGRFLRKDFTFDQFVVGANNDFAYSAALSLAAHKKRPMHSLFLLSKTGMGKSHLSQAIGHHILTQYPGDRVYYLTAEDFTQEMVSSYKSNSINSFKEKYHKNCDVLLLEDVHYLSGKERTQIELAHTLDRLLNDNKKIIFSSCCKPGEIPRLTENLRSRLGSGLISNIDPPDFRTRVKILKKFAATNQWNIPEKIIEYVAGELTEDVRQLKSGLVGIYTKSSLLGCRIDFSLADSVIKNMVRPRKAITIENIKKLVCKHYNISVKDLVSRSRKQTVVRPRQVAIYLARRYTDQPLQAIGRSFNRYHATALHAIGIVEKSMKQGGQLKRHVEHLMSKLDSGQW